MTVKRNIQEVTGSLLAPVSIVSTIRDHSKDFRLVYSGDGVDRELSEGLKE